METINIEKIDCFKKAIKNNIVAIVDHLNGSGRDQLLVKVDDINVIIVVGRVRNGVSTTTRRATISIKGNKNSFDMMYHLDMLDTPDFWVAYLSSRFYNIYHNKM